MERSEGGWVVVKPKPNKKFGGKAIDWLEKVIVKLMYKSNGPNCHFLSGNFAPIHEETPPCKDLPIKGYLPVSSYYFPLSRFNLYTSIVRYIINNFYVINVF